MAQKLIFDNKTIKRPGVYTAFQSGIDNPISAVEFGKVLIIDTGQGSGYAGGAGIIGTNSSGRDSVYEFRSLRDYTSLIRGSELWLIGQPLFQPLGPGNANGAPRVYFAKAAQTAPASISYTFSGGGSNGGSFNIQTRDEGTVANGVEDANDNLTKGYSAVMRASAIDSSKYVIDFFVGSFKGLDSESEPYDFVADINTRPILLVSSPQFDNIQTLIDWASRDGSFNQYFKLLGSSQANGTGAVNSTDLTNNSGNTLATGATETYSSAALNSVFDSVQDLDYTFILSLDNADDAQSVDNGAILSHLTTSAKYRKYMIIGGGNDSGGFSGSNSSIESAQSYNSERVIVVHGGVNLRRRGGSGFKVRDSLYKAALIAGRIAGLPPQVPVTFKALKFDADVHKLSSSQVEQALQNGVLVTQFDRDFGGNVVVQGINTLQDNEFFVDDQGRSYEISVESIKSQIDKSLQINAKIRLLGQSDGVNRNTLSTADVKNFTEKLLQSLEATQTADNIIISSRNVTVTVQGDAYLVRYEFEPNFPVNKLAFTGVIIDTTTEI